MSGVNNKKPIRKTACGNPDCATSLGVCGSYTFGSGNLDFHGYWEHPCAVCAREHEKLHPEDGTCWPLPETKKHD
jgi:hypothetical protein